MTKIVLRIFGIGIFHSFLYIYLVPFVIYPRFGQDGMTFAVIVAVLVSIATTATLWLKRKTKGNKGEYPMTNMIEWDEKYSVDVPELDESRKKLMDMFNALIEMKANKGDAKDVANLINEINEFSKGFFSTEEKVIGRQGYPDLDTHSKEHRQFIKRAIGLRRELAEDVDNLAMADVVELRDWLLSHFESADTLFVPFLRIHRYVDEFENKK